MLPVHCQRKPLGEECLQHEGNLSAQRTPRQSGDEIVMLGIEPVWPDNLLLSNFVGVNDQRL